MGRLLASIFGLRREEREMTLLLAIYNFILLITLYLLKPVRDSVFLSERGPEELPFVFILATLAVVPVALLHTEAGRRLRVGRLIDGVSLFLVFSILALRGLVAIEGTWSAYVLYAWVSIYGLLITSQFWLLANAVFTAAQAKRVFTALSVGAILGAVAGGEITGLLVDEMGVASHNLLWVTAGLLLASIGLFRWIRYRYRQLGGHLEGAPSGEPRTTRELPNTFQIILGSRHIQLIVGVIAVMVITTTFVDYQFKTVAAAAYPDEGELTTFMGRFYARVSLVALLVQFVLAPRLMRIFGIGGALALLPTALAIGTVGMIVVPGLAAGVLLRGADQSLKHSVDKTGRELLFVPVSLEKKKRVKVFLDLFVDQGAQGIGGALLLLFVVGMGLNVPMLGLVTLGLLVLWGLLAYRARHSYVDAFRRKLRRQETFQSTYGSGNTEENIPDDVDRLLESLCSHTETKALRALEEIEKGQMTVPIDPLRCLLDHPASAVREEVLRVLRIREVDGVATDVAEALTDPDPDVQLEAARYLYCNSTDGRLGRLHEGLSHEDVRIQAATVGLIAEEGGPQEYRLVTEPLLRRLVEAEGEVGEDARIHVARMLGVLDRPYRNELLFQLLQNDSAQVVRAAIEAAGKTGDRDFVYPLLKRLESETYEAAARRALVSYGRRILGTLYDHLADEQVDRSVRQRIPAILAAQSCQLAATVLVRSLDVEPLAIRHAVVRALSKVHAAGDFHFDPDAVDKAIYTEAEHYAALGQILYLIRRGRAPDDAVEPASLRAYREESLERIFRLLGLRYNQRDIYDAYLGITSADASLRASAVEFVDNLLEYGTSRYLLPLLDDPTGYQAVENGSRLFGRQIRRWEEAQSYLRDAPDPRLSSLLEDTADADREPAPSVTGGDGRSEEQAEVALPSATDVN